MPRTSRKKRPSGSLRLQKQIRATSAEWKAWGKHAARIGHSGVSSWLRQLANDEIRRAALDAERLKLIKETRTPTQTTPSSTEG